MIKRILSVGFFIICSVLFANASVQYMTIEKKNGEKYSFLLEDSPVITYSDGNLVVNGNDKTSFAIADVKNYHFSEENETGVKESHVDVLRIVNIDENTLQIQNALAFEKVVLIQSNGKLFSVTTSDSEGTANVKLPDQKGVYVLVVGIKSIKIIRK